MSKVAGSSSKAGGGTTAQPVDRLSLEVIIGKFSSPLTEEHAWAIVYEALKCLENLLRTFLVTTASGTKRSSTNAGSKDSNKLV